jgi:thiol-disulfide isomerase/thioredoxin
MTSGVARYVLSGVLLCGVLAPGALLPEKERKPAADFALQDSTGKMLKLSDLKGKVVLLNFWATWCGPCKLEIPWFEEFQTTYKGQPFTVVGVAMDDEGWKVVKPYIATAKMNYPVVVGNDKLADSYGGVDAMPTTLLIDKDGRIAVTHTGLISKEDYRTEILTLMGKAK